MTSETATIIAFPIALPTTNRPTEAKSRRSRFLSQFNAQAKAEPTLATRVIPRGATGAMAAKAKAEPRTAEEHASHVATVVRIAIRSAKRRGVSLESMLSIPRGWLLDLCDEGDPTCIVVRDWLTGGRIDLPQHRQDKAAAWHAKQQGDV